MERAVGLGAFWGLGERRGRAGGARLSLTFGRSEPRGLKGVIEGDVTER
ncbi:hypothetical protein [Myxococcus sp. CA040A]|nr:hypothetical protein [Myxococcus sp. CA040A]NTX00139.1 hypothetical protein [Myxococcus sp. CA040A]